MSAEISTATSLRRAAAKTGGGASRDLSDARGPAAGFPPGPPRALLPGAECMREDTAVAVMWGSEDLFAALGGTANRNPDGTLRDVARHVRSASLLAAKAYSRLALDSVYLDIKDTDGLRAEVDDAVAVGF